MILKDKVCIFMATDVTHNSSDSNTYCGFFNGKDTLITWGRTQEGIGQSSDGIVWSIMLSVENNSLMAQFVGSVGRRMKTVMMVPLR